MELADFEWLKNELHKRIREVETSMRGYGFEFDRKLLRYNDLVETCLRYADCSSEDIHFYEPAVPDPDHPAYTTVAFTAIFDVLSSCVKVVGPSWPGAGGPDPMYVAGQSPLTIVYDWLRNPVLVEKRAMQMVVA